MTYRPELLPTDLGRLPSGNAWLRSGVAATVGSLGESIIGVGDNLIEDKTVDNTFLMLAGTHEGLNLTGTGTQVSGQPGTQLTRLVTLAGTPQYLTALHLVGTLNSNNGARLMDITNTAGTYRFIGCRFTKDSSQAAEHVRLASGSKAIFIQCTFDGVASAVGDVINVMSGVAADCICIGCVNITGNVYGTITNLGSL